MPTQFLRRGFEELRFGDTVSPQAIDEAVMGVRKRQMHLRYENVRIISGIADDRCTLVIPLQIATAGRSQQLGGVAPLKQVRMTHGSVPIETFEIELRRS